VTVIHQHLNYAMLRLLANPIFYERINGESAGQTIEFFTGPSLIVNFLF